eukprot:scaffold4220_cov491-Prasinococcus_capsulatus_cf.AAC.1
MAHDTCAAALVSNARLSLGCGLRLDKTGSCSGIYAAGRLTHPPGDARLSIRVAYPELALGAPSLTDPIARRCTGRESYLVVPVALEDAEAAVPPRPSCTRCVTVCGERLSIASGWKCCVESLVRTCVGVLVCACMHVRSFACEAGCTSMPVLRAGRTRCSAAVQASSSSPRARTPQRTISHSRTAALYVCRCARVRARGCMHESLFVTLNICVRVYGCTQCRPCMD